MDNLVEVEHKPNEHESSDSVTLVSDSDWTIAKTIDELLCNLATAEQTVTNESGEILTIRKYLSLCMRLWRWIPVALPTPEYVIDLSDLRPEVRRALEKLHPAQRSLLAHQAVLRLFEAIGIEPYNSIGRKLIVKLVGG